MATLTTTPIKVFVSGETVTPTKLNELSQSTVALTAGTIEDADVSASAAIALSKLATGALPSAITISTANLVAAVANALVPVSTVQSFARSTAPTGWLAANGDTIGSASSNATNASADYSALFTVLWDNWTNTDLPILTSAGAASTRGASASADFVANKRLPLPDLRGIFVRGSGSQTISGTSYSGTFATKQAESVNSNSVLFRQSSNHWAAGGGGVGIPMVYAGANVAAYGTGASYFGGAETRPANIALLYCIKF